MPEFFELSLKGDRTSYYYKLSRIPRGCITAFRQNQLEGYLACAGCR